MRNTDTKFQNVTNKDPVIPLDSQILFQVAAFGIHLPTK